MAKFQAQRRKLLINSAVSRLRAEAHIEGANRSDLDPSKTLPSKMAELLLLVANTCGQNYINCPDARKIKEALERLDEAAR
jgi:hypothetical protein